MKDLEDLKNKWAKQDFSQSYSKEEIKGFLQKKSTHSIKWIFYLSIVEFVLYLSFPLLVPNYIKSFDYYKSLNLFEFSIVTTMLGYVLLLYFMWHFFQNYKKISVANSIKDHLSAILNTRRAVNQYFYFNVAILIIFTIVVLVAALERDKNMIALQEENNSLIMIIFMIGILIAIILGLFGLLYYFVYGRFLRPLKNNEKELLRIED
ncbi:MAG: hypothetical protein L7U68_08105 [Flavobacteriaceae bacterium]|nr:hypothetical protein [Flavobacteriaceae bacterium]